MEIKHTRQYRVTLVDVSVVGLVVEYTAHSSVWVSRSRNGFSRLRIRIKHWMMVPGEKREYER